MKRNLVLLALFILSVNIVIANSGIYTNEYVKHLKNCEVYIEKYDAQIPTPNEDSKSINLQTTESILGWKNGKCLTKSVVYSKDIKKDILVSNCVFSETQLDSVVKKMQPPKSKDIKAQQQAQENLSKYINDNNICTTKNLIN